MSMQKNLCQIVLIVGQCIYALYVMLLAIIKKELI